MTVAIRDRLSKLSLRWVGSPLAIVKSALKNKHADYDKRYVLMDSDIEIPQQCLAYAKKNKVTIILSTPVCLEGMLLEVLELRVVEGARGFR